MIKVNELMADSGGSMASMDLLNSVADDSAWIANYAVYDKEVSAGAAMLMSLLCGWMCPSWMRWHSCGKRKTLSFSYFFSY
jgi:hypothetical protein